MSTIPVTTVSSILRNNTYPDVFYMAYYQGGGTVTVMQDSDFSAPLSAGVLAMPGFPISSITTSPVTVADSFFGMTVQYRVNDSDSSALAGIKTVRSHDITAGTGTWKYIETSNGVYNWTNIDAWVNTHYGAGRDLIFTLFGTPTWASVRPTEVGIYGPGYLGLSAPPASMSDWTDYCTAVATRYAGKIKYYEIWNEPNYINDGTTLPNPVYFFSGTWVELSTMVRLANQAIKAVDPTAKILCPPVQGWAAASNTSNTYFTGMMAASDGATGTMKDWVDIIAVHLYPPSVNRTQDIDGAISQVKASIASAGISSSMEIWDTESAPIGIAASQMTDNLLNQVMGRMWLTMAGRGIKRTVYYQLDSTLYGFLGRQAVYDNIAYLQAFLKGGTILNMNKFSDGRIACWTSGGVVII